MKNLPFIYFNGASTIVQYNPATKTRNLFYLDNTPNIIWILIIKNVVIILSNSYNKTYLSTPQNQINDMSFTAESQLVSLNQYSCINHNRFPNSGVTQTNRFNTRY